MICIVIFNFVYMMNFLLSFWNCHFLSKTLKCIYIFSAFKKLNLKFKIEVTNDLYELIKLICQCFCNYVIIEVFSQLITNGAKYFVLIVFTEHWLEIINFE